MFEFYGGLNARVFDTRNFVVGPEGLRRICNEFNIGLPSVCRNDYDFSLSHSNFILFPETSKGRFVLKFYPSFYRSAVLKEFMFSRYAYARGFSTPFMHTTRKNKTHILFGHYIVVCFDFINGVPLHDIFLDDAKIRQMSQKVGMLNRLLAGFFGDDRFSRFADFRKFTEKIQGLRNFSSHFGNYRNKTLISNLIRDIELLYLRRKRDFIEVPLHSNLSLSNALIFRRRIYIYDLSHVRRDYLTADLANLVSFALLLGIAEDRLKLIISCYFSEHGLKEEYSDTFNVFLKLNLIADYLKTIQKKILAARLKKTMPVLIYNNEIDKRLALLSRLMRQKKPVGAF